MREEVPALWVCRADEAVGNVSRESGLFIMAILRISCRTSRGR